MDDPITVKFRWTAEENIAAQEAHFRVICRPLYRYGISLIAFLAIFAGYASYRTSGWNTATIFLPVAGLYWFFVYRFDKRWAIRRGFKKRPDQNMEVKWMVTDEDFRIQTAESESKSSWKLLTRVVRTRLGFLVYPSPGMYQWLPFHGFTWPDEVDRLEQVFQRHLPNYSRIDD